MQKLPGIYFLEMKGGLPANTENVFKLPISANRNSFFVIVVLIKTAKFYGLRINDGCLLAPYLLKIASRVPAVQYHKESEAD